MTIDEAVDEFMRGGGWNERWRPLLTTFAKHVVQTTRPRQALDKEAFFRVSSNADAWLRLAGVMTEAELEQALRGAVNVYIVLEHEFQRRFPEAYARYEAESSEP